MMKPRDRLETEYGEAFSAWKTAPGPGTAGPLLKAVDPVLKSAVRAFAPNSGPAMRAKAKQIALSAFPTYDPTVGPLKPHLMSRLQGLRRAAGRESAAIRLPERVMLDRLRLDEADKELADEFGRAPSDAELADRTSIPLNRIEYVRRARKPLSEGRVLAGNGDEDDGPGSPAVQIPGVDPGESEWIEFVYAGLGPQDQYVMEQALGLRGRKPVAAREIARGLGVSPGAVSQRMQRIQTLIDSRTEAGLL